MPHTTPSALSASAAPGPADRSKQGVFGRVKGWFSNGASTSGRRAASGSTPEFTAQTENPDKHRTAVKASGTSDLESEWRHECLAFGRRKDLSHVRDMRIVYQAPEASLPDGALAVVGVGAHYRSAAVSKEDLLLHIVQEMEQVGTKPFVVVFFAAEASLSALPDLVFFGELHSALDPDHRQRLQTIYVVHPNALLKTWVLRLRMQEPAVYGKVQYVERLNDLYRLFGDSPPKVPQHVLDHDAAMGK